MFENRSLFAKHFAWAQGPPGGPPPPPVTLTVRYDDADGVLMASFPPGAFGPPPPPPAPEKPAAAMTPQERERAEARRVIAQVEGGAFEYALVPRAEGIFLMGWIDDGVLLDVEQLFHEFELENGKAVRLTVRGENDMILGKATREK
jgi:hypothetical protein